MPNPLDLPGAELCFDPLAELERSGRSVLFARAARQQTALHTPCTQEHTPRAKKDGFKGLHKGEKQAARQLARGC